MQNKTIMEEMNDEEQRIEAKRVVQLFYNDDKEIFNLASKLIQKLALGGFWKGHDLALLYCIKALKEAQSKADIHTTLATFDKVIIKPVRGE